MPNEFTMSNHSGDAPRDLREADPRPRPVPFTGDDYRQLLEDRGDHDIATMLFAPVRLEKVKQSRKAKKARRARELAQLLAFEPLGGAA